MIKIYAPASAANLSVGFDVLGAAITPIDGTLLGDCVSAEFSDEFSLINRGHFVNALPADPKENIVYQCWLRFCQALQRTVTVNLILEKNMPIGSGLGSSACSVVATLVALNELMDRPFSQQEMLCLMGEMEGRISGSIHYDNVAPCYLGGLQLILEEGDTLTQTLPHFENWYWVMAYPGIKVSTAEARAILPAMYKKQDCVDHARHLAGFIYASYTQQAKLAAALMKDVIAEPFRQSLLPNFSQSRDTILKLGGLACGISGSGPTLFAVADNLQTAKEIEQWLSVHYLQNSDGFTHICHIDTIGTRKLD